MGRRRNQNRAAMMIVVISAICMIALMVMFFSMALDRQNNPPDTPIRTGASDDTGVLIGGDTDEVLPPQNTDAADGTSAVDTAPNVQTEPVMTAPPAPVTTEAQTEKQDPPKTPVTPDSIPTVYDDKLLAEVALPEGTAPAGYVDKLVFYGDSTTHGMKAYKVFGSRDTKQVWTPTSGTLALFRAATDLVWNPNTQSEMSLADLCKTEKPEYLVVDHREDLNGICTAGAGDLQHHDHHHDSFADISEGQYDRIDQQGEDQTGHCR